MSNGYLPSSMRTISWETCSPSDMGETHVHTPARRILIQPRGVVLRVSPHFSSVRSSSPPKSSAWGITGGVRCVGSSALPGVAALAPIPERVPPVTCIPDSSRNTSSLGYKLPCLARASGRSRRTGPRSVIQLTTAPPVPLLTFLILWDGKAGREAGFNGRETALQGRCKGV